MYSIIYLVGLIVIVMFILSLLGALGKGGKGDRGWSPGRIESDHSWLEHSWLELSGMERGAGRRRARCGVVVCAHHLWRCDRRFGRLAVADTSLPARFARGSLR